MGTGKTQFTKSLIAQLYREQGKNVEGLPIGILIFDYKGDYNKYIGKTIVIIKYLKGEFEDFYGKINQLNEKNMDLLMMPILMKD